MSTLSIIIIKNSSWLNTNSVCKFSAQFWKKETGGGEKSKNYRLTWSFNLAFSSVDFCASECREVEDEIDRVDSLSSTSKGFVIMSAEKCKQSVIKQHNNFMKCHHEKNNPFPFPSKEFFLRQIDCKNILQHKFVYKPFSFSAPEDCNLLKSSMRSLITLTSLLR